MPHIAQQSQPRVVGPTIAVTTAILILVAIFLSAYLQSSGDGAQQVGSTTATASSAPAVRIEVLPPIEVVGVPEKQTAGNDTVVRHRESS